MRSFHWGGTEAQVVELLRGLSPACEARVAVIDEVGPFTESVWQMGYLPERFPLRGTLAQPNTAAQIARLAFWLKRGRIDVLHAHDYYTALLGVPAAKLAGCRVVVGRLDLAHWHSRVQRAALVQLTRRADGVVANAEAIRRMLIETEEVEPSRVVVIHNGLDLNRFDQALARGLSAPLPDTGGEPFVLHVANMNHPVKRQEDVLLAMVAVRKAGGRLHAFFIGDGPRRPELEARAQALGLREVAHFLGHRNDVPAVYERSVFGVLCSTAEGLSNAVMEGMAAERPMVVTSVGGNPELVEEGKRGKVVPPESPQQLAQAFLQILADGEAARQMGKAARRFVQSELSLQRMVQAHEALYQRLAPLSG